VVDTGQGTQTFEIVARKAGRRIEITTARGVVEVTEVTRSGTPIRAGRFMANRLIALVEHPAEPTRKRETDADETMGSTRTRRPSSTDPGRDSPRQLTVLGDDECSAE